MFKKRSTLWVAVALTVSSLFAVGYGGGCYNLATQSITDSIRPCGIFDCSNGLLGGALNPCNPNSQIFVGCP